MIYPIKTKFYKMAFVITMCTFVHSSIHMCGVSVSMVYMRCISWGMCMNIWILFLMKHKFQFRVVKCILAQSGAQTINILLQNRNIIFNFRRRNMSMRNKIFFSLNIEIFSFSFKTFFFFKELFSFKAISFSYSIKIT